MPTKYKIPASRFLRLLNQLNQKDLQQIKGIGDVLINKIQSFTTSKRYHRLIDGFEILEKQNKAVYIELSENNEFVKEGVLNNQIICITGTFEISRTKIADKLIKKGAKVVDSITKNTTILLVGQKAGSKLKQAQELGIRIENDLNRLLNA